MPNSLGETKPQWWPNDVIFEDDILLKTSNRGVSKIDSWLLILVKFHWPAFIWIHGYIIIQLQMRSRNLRKIITAVYEHYESQFLLDFSKRLMLCFTQQIIDIKENGNGTRSMISQNKKLLVTFKEENMVS